MVVRNGNFFKWKDSFYNQVSGCGLGDPDSCSYCDISVFHLLDLMIPSCETALGIHIDPFFKIYRDDGLGFVFGNCEIVMEILNFFNDLNDKIKWTIPDCSICSLPEVMCPHYKQLNFLDVSISWKQVSKNGVLLWQFQTATYSKPTDVHAYLHPTSCTSPHLNSKGISVVKTVGTRLRTIHSNDQALLSDLNVFSGYLIARGYKEDSVKQYLANMANRAREMLISGEYRRDDKYVMPLVTSHHPATTILTSVVKKAFDSASLMDPALRFVIPTSSVVVAYKRLPNLQLLLCKNDQNSLVSPPQHPANKGYQDTGCRCLLCDASTFGSFVESLAMPGYRPNLPHSVNCRTGPAVVYHAVCHSGRSECSLAHYVGRAFSNDSGKFPMRLRWSTHKSYHKTSFNGCRLTQHLLRFHKGEDPQTFVKIKIIDKADTLEEVLRLELMWTRKLFAFEPTGLNVREEEKED